MKSKLLKHGYVFPPLYTKKFDPGPGRVGHGVVTDPWRCELLRQGPPKGMTFPYGLTCSVLNSSISLFCMQDNATHVPKFGRTEKPIFQRVLFHRGNERRTDSSNSSKRSTRWSAPAEKEAQLGQLAIRLLSNVRFSRSSLRSGPLGVSIHMGSDQKRSSFNSSRKASMPM